MACLSCEHSFECACYLIDIDNPQQEIDPKDIQNICKVMGGYNRKNCENRI